MTKIGVLFINLGTPDDCSSRSVYRYLTEFLNDPRVIDLPSIVRWILVNLLIVPFRFKKTLHAYQQVWTPTGSPLLVNSRELVAAVAALLGNDFQVELGMRYGQPSIESAIEKLRGVQEIVVLPLFPQYASAATGSAMAEVFRVLQKQWNIPSVHIKKDFYDHPAFITAYASIIQKHLAEKKPDLILFSYHGLPERHIDKSACKASCDRLQACPLMQESNAYCYRAECYATSRLLAQALHLSPTDYHVTFQSRLGKTPWIKPYTDEVLVELRQKNIKNIAIVCPSFVADCLETLEEINIRARADWQRLGGNEFIFIPCLNQDKTWVQGLAAMVKEYQQ